MAFVLRGEVRVAPILLEEAGVELVAVPGS
jgi:hypothetical protein